MVSWVMKVNQFFFEWTIHSLEFKGQISLSEGVLVVLRYWMFFVKFDFFENGFYFSLMFLNELVCFLKPNPLDVRKVVAASHDTIDNEHVKCKGME